MKRAASFAFLALYALIIFGCGSSGSNSMINNPASPQVRVVQGGVSSESVDLLVNGAKAQTREALTTTWAVPRGEGEFSLRFAEGTLARQGLFPESRDPSSVTCLSASARVTIRPTIVS